MSDHRSGEQDRAALVLVVGIVVVVCVIAVAAALVLIFAPDGRDVAPLVGAIAPTVAALAALAGVTQLRGKVNKVEQHTTDLTNGLLDAKVRASVADVIPDHLLDDTYKRRQLAEDRIRRRTAAMHATGEDPDLTAGP